MTRWSFHGGCHLGLGIVDNFFGGMRSAEEVFVAVSANPTGVNCLFPLNGKRKGNIVRERLQAQSSFTITLQTDVDVDRPE
jgi:hypothetical protein